MLRHRWVLWCLALLAGCGKGGDVGSLNAPPLIWVGNDNGAWVLDADGSRYEFDLRDGCIQSANIPPRPPVTTSLIPCLEQASSGGLANWGTTVCGYPNYPANCASEYFGVYLTKDIGNPSGCMAVLGTSAGAASATGTILGFTPILPPLDEQFYYSFSVYSVSSSFFPTYWNGTIPICGGSNRFEGTYVGTATYCGSQEAIEFTIDSGGVINSDAMKVSGTISSPAGTGQFTQANNAVTQCPQSTFTLSSATQDGQGMWVLSGESFEVTQQAPLM